MQTFSYTVVNPPFTEYLSIYTHTDIHTFKIQQNRDFLGGTVVKNLPANAGDTGSSPGPGRSHMPQSN